MSGDTQPSPHEEALDPYNYYVMETPLGNWEVRKTPDGRPLCILPHKGAAYNVVNTINAEYNRVYDKGLEDGYGQGYRAAKGIKNVPQQEQAAHEGYQPDGAVDLGDPPGDE